MSKSIRFIHASDFHLETPVGGLAEVPNHLRDLLIDAPFSAAERVFDEAVREKVDFILLAGDIVRPKDAGPRGLEFLRQQFRRMDKLGAAVYWAPGRADARNAWPVSIPFPTCVHRFTSRKVEAIDYQVQGETCAQIRGSGKSAKRINTQAYDLSWDGPPMIRIAVAHGETTLKDVNLAEIDYWALGGKHSHEVICRDSMLAQYCGSPQARLPHENGPHGCQFVTFDHSGQVDSQLVPTDVVRWHSARVELAPDTADRELYRFLCGETERLLDENPGVQMLARWSVADGDQLTDTQSDQLAARLRQDKLARKLVHKLQRKYGQEVPGVWTVEVEAEPPDILPRGWYEEDTVLGDLLRLVQNYQEDAEAPIQELEEFLTDARVAPEVAARLRITSRREREEVLRRVAVMGVDLLRGQRVLSEE